MAVHRRTKNQAWVPTPNMLKVLQAASECGLGDSMVSIAKRAAVRRATIYEWMNPNDRRHQPKFVALWDGLMKRMCRLRLPTTIGGVGRKAVQGEAAQARIILEGGGYLKSAGEMKIEGRLTLEQLVAGAENGRRGRLSGGE